MKDDVIFINPVYVNLNTELRTIIKSIDLPGIIPFVQP
jgi:hypothetical protein